MKSIEHSFWILGDVPERTIEQLQSEGWSPCHRWNGGAKLTQNHSQLVGEPELDIDCVQVFHAFAEGNGAGDHSRDQTYLSVRDNNLKASNWHVLDGSNAEGESNGS
jgi:hypothetical protein